MPKSISITGDDNEVEIGGDSELAGGTISIKGHRNRVIIGTDCRIRGEIYIKGNDCIVDIREGASILGLRATVGEGTSLRIGRECLFSRGIEIRTTDEHPIYDRTTRELINRGRSVVIGQRVWLGRAVSVNKGAEIPDGCVIGTCSLVSGLLPTPNAIYACTPARLIREDIIWGKHKKSVPWDEAQGADAPLGPASSP